jgi:membrane-bound serine protease (ClpP class)
MIGCPTRLVNHFSHPLLDRRIRQEYGIKMKKLIISIISLLLFGLSGTTHSSEKSYALIDLEGTVNPIISAHIVQAIKQANKDGSSFIVLTINTPGGLMSSMREIITAILTSDIPVVAYTYPKGAQAASAGGFIMLSGHVTAMAPGTEIGAMHPVSPFVDFGTIGKEEKGKTPGQEVMAAKVLNDTVAYGRSIAQKRGRSVTWTEDAIRKAISASYKDAKAIGIVDIIAEDIPDLLKQLDGRRVNINGKNVVFETRNIRERTYAMNWKQRTLNFFADPQIVFFLFIIAVIGIWIEIKNPGLIVPGVIGALSLLIFLMAIRILPVNIAGLILIILAITLFVLELKFVSYGLLSLAGIASFIAGALILFDSPLGGFSIPISSIIATVLLVLIFIFGILRSIIRVHKGKVSTGVEGIVGEEGTAATAISVKGKVHVHGELWNARSDEPIEMGGAVRVVSVDEMVLVVKKV